MRNILRKIKWGSIAFKRNLVNKIKTYFFIKKLLKSRKSIKLEFGSTEKRIGMEDWNTVDINSSADICLDLSKPIPIPDNSVDVIYSSHLLEHISYPNPMINLLKECHRILKPGGKFSVCVPNAKIYAEIYLKIRDDINKFFDQRSDVPFNSSIDYLNHMAYMRGEHKYMFDKENLPIILSKSGFLNVKLRNFNPILDKKERDFESIYAEGEKQ